MASAGHPVEFDIEPAERLSRRLVLVKWLLALPHTFLIFFLLWPAHLLLSVGCGVWAVVAGRYPQRLLDYSDALLLWFSRYIAYHCFFRDEYPPFTFKNADYPIYVSIYRPEHAWRPGAALRLMIWFPFLWVLTKTFFVAWSVLWGAGFWGVIIRGRYPTITRKMTLGFYRIMLSLYCLPLTPAFNPLNWLKKGALWGRFRPADSRSMGDSDVSSGGTPRSDEELLFEVRSPKSLPDFSDVGGMNRVKQELRETVGLLLACPDLASRYGISWNGILLYGPPGTGKSFLAQAVAGEFALNFIAVGAGELLSAYRGGAARRIIQAFRAAERNLPCVLFFDEFDSVAVKRGSTPQNEERSMVSQLLRSVEHYRDTADLVIIAATNLIDDIDEAVVRPGRFDRKVRIDLPDRSARADILRVLLAKRPTSGVDISAFAAQVEGLSAATIRQVVEVAALEALRREMRREPGVITGELLIEALRARGGQDRPLAQEWSWDELIVPVKTKAELMQFERFIEDPDIAARYGIDPPTGLLLYGPPGTGKTTIAKVLAAQAAASFYAIAPSDLMSKWVGETEDNIAQIFRRARENRPSIIFLDEIDALFPKRGMMASFDDRWTDQLLHEIDGMHDQRGVFVVGATNRPDILDPALLRGGRLSRQIEIPLPDRECRAQLLALFCKSMPLEDVDLHRLASETEGYSGADLKALTQDAALKAAVRSSGNGTHERNVSHHDFVASLHDFRTQKGALRWSVS